MQPGFGGSLYTFLVQKDIFWITGRLKATPVLFSGSIHKSLCCCSRCPRNGHQPLSDQWQSSSCRCVWILSAYRPFHCFCFDVAQLHCQVVFNLPKCLEFTPPCVCLCLCTYCLCLVASFGTGSMSMPAGFGNASSYCLPTSFSGNFQQQFPGQAPIPYSQPGAYHPQSNG